MQDIADSLSTSRISVWKALNNKPGVSDDLRMIVVNEAIKMGYIKRPFHDDNHKNNIARTVAVVMSRPESSIFWMQIIHEIAKELALNGINLMYTYMPSRWNEGDSLPPALTDGSVSGIIVLNIYLEQQLKMISNLPLPKVFLDSVPALLHDDMNGDIVFIEGRSSIREIAGRLLDIGCNKLGFIGDINYAQTNMDRYLGFVDAFSERNLKIDKTFIMTESLDLDTHYQQIERFLSSLKSMPDGFVCVSDYIAHFVQRCFTDIGIDQSKIYLTGFDNTSEHSNVAEKITSVDVQTGSMGERLANKILFALKHPNLPHEVSYVLTKVVYRNLP